MGLRPRPLTPLVAAGIAGIAVWFTAGTVGFVRMETGVGRLGLLPPMWVLAILVAGFIAAAWAGRLSARTALPLFFSSILLLPWLPGSVPAAFLMWTGHVAAAVWIGIAIVIASEKGAGPPGPFFADPRRAPVIAAVIAALLYMGAAWRLASFLPGGDEPHYLVIAQSLLHDHDLQIENNHTRGDYREYFNGPLRPDYLRRGVNGQIYSVHAPGLSAIVAPAYAIGGYPGVVIFLSIVAAIGTALMWRACHVLTGSSSAAWFGWAAWTLTVPFFFEAFAVYPDGIGATLVIFAASRLVQEQRAESREQSGQKRIWIVTGAALALLPWLHTRFVILAGMLGAIFVLRLIRSPNRRANVAAFLSVPIISAIFWFGFFRVIYGTFNPAAPYNGYTQSSPANISTGLPALLFDQQFGLLPNAPVYGFCLLALVSLTQRRSRLAIELSATTAAYLLTTSAFYMWWAGSAAPARFWVPILPLLVIPGASLWASGRGATRAVAMAALLVSLLITAALVGVDAGRLAYNFRDGYSLFAEWLSPTLDLPRSLPSFFRQTARGATVRAVFWLSSMAAAWLGLLAVERVRRTSDARSVLRLATPIFFAAATMLAITAVWKVDAVAGPSPDTSSLNLLEHFDPRIRPNGVNLAAFDLMSSDQIVDRLEISTSERRLPPRETLLLVPGKVPAGRYELRFPSGVEPAGTAALVVGRNARPIANWNLQRDVKNGALRFDLPVNIGSFVVNGNDEAVSAAGAVSLHPIDVIPPRLRLTHKYARRAERYGPGIAFFFDDGAFVEGPGFWVRGGAATEIAAMPSTEQLPLHLFVRNAPVENRVDIVIDGQSETLNLNPGEQRLLPIKIDSERRGALLDIHSENGFRPSSVEAGSTDARFLGVWIELR